jgi:kynurenine formamidase
MPSSPAVKYTPNKIHYFLHKNDIPVVEWCVNMKNLRKKRFILAICALPASHQGGFPAQVLALEKW